MLARSKRERDRENGGRNKVRIFGFRNGKKMQMCQCSSTHQIVLFEWIYNAEHVSLLHGTLRIRDCGNYFGVAQSSRLSATSYQNA